MNPIGWNRLHHCRRVGIIFQNLYRYLNRTKHRELNTIKEQISVVCHEHAVNHARAAHLREVGGAKGINPPWSRFEDSFCMFRHGFVRCK